MLILLRLTRPWCQTILREITLRINVVPCIIPRISIEKSSSYSVVGLSFQVLQVLYLLITQLSPNKKELEPFKKRKGGIFDSHILEISRSHLLLKG